MEKIQKFLANDKFQSVSMEVDYFLQQYKAENELQEKLLQNSTGKIFKLSVAGVCLGVSLSLSLRRYLPTIFGEISPLRLMFETAMVLGGYVQFTKFATYSVYQDLYPLRKGAVLDNDPEFLKLLHKKISNVSSTIYDTA